MAALDAAAEATKTVVEEVFGRKRPDGFVDGWLSPIEFGPVLAMLETAPGGATLEPGHVVGIMMHQKQRIRKFVPAAEGAGSRCREASLRVTMKHFSDGGRSVDWDLTPTNRIIFVRR